MPGDSRNTPDERPTHSFFPASPGGFLLHAPSCQVYPAYYSLATGDLTMIYKCEACNNGICIMTFAQDDHEPTADPTDCPWNGPAEWEIVPGRKPATFKPLSEIIEVQ